MNLKWTTPILTYLSNCLCSFFTGQAAWRSRRNDVV